MRGSRDTKFLVKKKKKEKKKQSVESIVNENS